MSNSKNSAILLLLFAVFLWISLMVLFANRPRARNPTTFDVNAVAETIDLIKTAAEPTPPRIAFVFAGSVRSFVCPKVHWSIRSHLIDALGGEPFVFVRVSTEDNKNIQTGQGTLWRPSYEANAVNETLRILNPRRVDYFSFADQIEEMKRNYPGPAHTVFRENDQRRYSMFYHRCMSYRMARDYEEANGMRFDWMVLVRLDAAWLEPILPIQSYAKDRVWLTETGFDLFNDQFMLIPRQFSDYLYDLDTKVAKGVYCLGGPDVEKWKCNRTELTQRSVEPTTIDVMMEYCCADVARRNSLGYSEIIHRRHLTRGRIPVAVGRFPVYLTRLREGGACEPECERLMFNFKEHYSHYHRGAYKFFANLSAADTRGRPISNTDHSKCLVEAAPMMTLWSPLSAAQLHQSNQHAAAAVDYSKSLYDQRGALHPSVLLNPRDLEAWRVHPTWNVEGCLTLSFTKKALGWSPCREHFKLKGGFLFDPQQTFLLQVVPHPMAVEQGLFEGGYGGLRHVGTSYLGGEAPVANFTRIVLPDREPSRWNPTGKFICMTIVGEAKLRAAVGMADCLAEKLHPSQLFRTVAGLTRGTHHETTVGRLHVASAPRLCVTRSDHGEQGEAMAVSDGRLRLGDCFEEEMQQRVLFEFELVW